MQEMKKVVKCPQCGRLEYYGMLHWRDGKEMCRECIYYLWEKEGPWRRTACDHVYPKYSDGKDYTQLTAQDREIISTESIF